MASAGWETFGSVRTSTCAKSAARMSSAMDVPTRRERGWRRILRQLKTRRGLGAAARATDGARVPVLTAALAIFDPRIEKGVQHVHDKVHRQETERTEQHDPLHDRIVPP